MPTAAYQSHLFIIHDDKGRAEIPLDRELHSIGRDPDCDIRLVSQFVSRRHATLVQLSNDDGTYCYRIVDGIPAGRSSSNGLVINGLKLRAHTLEHEDEIVFGPKVTATYLLLRRDEVTAAPDKWDITLIGPNMMGYPEKENANSDNLHKGKFSETRLNQYGLNQNLVEG
ncbi:MAG: phosphopeptide-binding protein [Leptolyngbya sp.]|nr:MAG: phosphopeptide-binding protein [Leptolyngbya sp.]